MGKNKYSARESGERTERHISRALFRRAVNEGIRRAGDRIYDFVPRSSLDELKENATEIDAGCWRARGSCGCPMVALGAVSTYRDVFNKPEGTVDPTSTINNFAMGFDNTIAVNGRCIIDG